MKINLAQSKLSDAIQANLVTYMRLFAGLPGIAVEDNETFWIVSGHGAPGNNILLARWGEGDTDRRIDALYAAVGQHLDEIEWLLFPCDRPADLGTRLEARGMPPGMAGNWLWLDFEKLAACPPVPDPFHIEQVKNDRQMAEWLRATEAGFGGELQLFYDAYARHGYAANALSLHYIGYLGDTPVTSGTLLDAGGTAAVYDLSTPPEYRGQGFGGALTYFLLAETQKRGYSETWIWSSDMAKSLYQKLGFIEADFGIRAYVWKKGL